MKTVSVKVIGKRPILFNAFKIEQVSSLSKVKSGSAGNNPEEWKTSVLEKNGQLYIPNSYWSSCLKEAAKYTKAGRGTIQKSFLSCCILLNEFSFLDRSLPEGWEKMTYDEM